MQESELRDYLPLIDKIALKLYRGLPSWVELSDLKSAGNLGMVRAINTYDPRKGVPFGAYATLKIRGAMLEYVRSQGPLTRTQRARLADIREYLQGKDPVPVATEISEATGIDLAMVEYLTGSPGVLLPVPADLCDPSVNPSDLYLGKQFAECADAVLREMSESDRALLREYYLEDRIYEEIGEARGVTGSRAYQLVKASLARASKVADRLFVDLREAMH